MDGRGSEIYNTRAGKWEKSVVLNTLATGDKKTYHIRSTEEGEPITVGYIIGTPGVALLQRAAKLDPDAEDTPEALNQKGIAVAVWREKVLTYLNKCVASDMSSSGRASLYKEGEELLLALKTVAEEDGWKDNCAMRQMQDDVYIAMRSLRCDNGNMYAGARLRSLGSQRAYNVCDLKDMTPRDAAAAAALAAPPLRRGGSLPRRVASAAGAYQTAPDMTPRSDGSFSPPEMVGMGDVGDGPQHMMSQDPQSCFASPSAAAAMRQCSAQPRLERGSD